MTTNQQLDDLRSQGEELDDRIYYWENATLHLLGCSKEIADCKTCQAIQEKSRAR